MTNPAGGSGRRKGGPTPDIHLRGTVQELRSVSFRVPGTAVDYQVVAHPDAVATRGRVREHHTGVPTNVRQLFLATVQMGRDQLVALQADPHDRHRGDRSR